MAIIANQLKPGSAIEFRDDVYVILTCEHVKPGKGPAYTQVKMKGVRSGSIVENRFGSQEKVEPVRIEKTKMEYLYDEGDNLVFMNSENYDQVPISKEFVGDKILYLLPNTAVDVEFIGEEPVGINLPGTVVLQIEETEPGIKGASVTNVPKPAKMETGLVVNVPPFIETGEKIKVNTSNGEYVERVKG
jgi:elongation factor P